MKTYFLKSIILLLFLLTQLNCKTSRDDVNNENPTYIEVVRFQIVTLDAEDAKSGQNYNATLNSKPVKVTSSEDNRIIAIIPIDATLGKNDLVVSGLNKTFHFNVKDGKLLKSADETVNEYLSIINGYTSNLDNSIYSVNLKKDIENFKKVFNNSSVADKEKMALFYQNNKSFYDGIISSNIGKLSSGYDETDEADSILLQKYAPSVYMLGVSVAAFILIEIPQVQIIAALGILVSLEKSVKFAKLFVNGKMVTIESEMSGRPNAGEIKFESGITKNVSLTTKKRSIINSDNGSNAKSLMLFFNVFNKFDNLRVVTNTAFKWLNDNIPLCNFTLTPKEDLPLSQTPITIGVSATAFPRFNFSIENPAIILEKPTFNNTGSANFTLKFVDANATQPTYTRINYTYRDNYATVSGAIPVFIEKSSKIAGKWYQYKGEFCDVTLFGTGSDLEYYEYTKDNKFYQGKNSQTYLGVYEFTENQLKLIYQGGSVIIFKIVSITDQEMVLYQDYGTCWVYRHYKKL